MLFVTVRRGLTAAPFKHIAGTYEEWCLKRTLEYFSNGISTPNQIAHAE
jgi:hypothetical protein